MKKFTKLAIAGLLVATAVTGVGCSSSETTTNATADAPAKADDKQKQYQAAFAAALIAESQLLGQFEDKKGLEGGKEVAFKVSAQATKEDAITFLASNYWSKEVVTKEYEAVLGDAALLEKANKALQEKHVADKAKGEFKPVTIVADDAKLGANALGKANFADVKAEEKDGKFVLEYKGLKYTMEKNEKSYRVVGKEGTLQK